MNVLITIKNYGIFFLLIFTNLTNAQKIPALIKNAELPFKKHQKSKVLILGTFHFKDGGHDAYQPKYSVNIKSEQRQNEVKELLKMMADFNLQR